MEQAEKQRIVASRYVCTCVCMDVCMDVYVSPCEGMQLLHDEEEERCRRLVRNGEAWHNNPSVRPEKDDFEDKDKKKGLFRWP